MAGAAMLALMGTVFPPTVTQGFVGAHDCAPARKLKMSLSLS